MAMVQAGMGLPKLILVLAGTGYTGAYLLKDRKFSDVVAELMEILKESKKSGGSSDDSSEADILREVRYLSERLKDMSRGQITVLNGSSPTGMTSFAMPAAALGALGYGYMWWKGLKFSDLMYVTKSGMANAVSNMTNHLEQVSAALAAAKRHLTQRLMNLDGKLDEQREMSKLIKEDVNNVRVDISQIGFDLDSLHRMVEGLDGKIGNLERKQDITNRGVIELLRCVGMKDEDILKNIQALPMPNKPRGFIANSENPTMMGLKQITDVLIAGSNMSVDDPLQSDSEIVRSGPRSLSRTTSIKC